MLVAVPIAAAFGVLVRFALESYRKSRLYLGLDSLDEGGGPDAS
jgi:hypothetical protein